MHVHACISCWQEQAYLLLDRTVGQLSTTDDGSLAWAHLFCACVTWINLTCAEGQNSKMSKPCAQPDQRCRLVQPAYPLILASGRCGRMAKATSVIEAPRNCIDLQKVSSESTAHTI